MKTFAVFHKTAKEAPRRSIKDALLKAGISGHLYYKEYPANEMFGPSYMIRVPADEWEVALDIIRSFFPDATLTRYETDYTRAELDSAELLVVTLDRAPAGDFIGTPAFDWSSPDACQVCWSGARLKGPVQVEISARALRSPVNDMYVGSFLIDDTVRTKLLDGGALATDFLRVQCISEGGQDLATRHVIQPERELLPRDPSWLGTAQIDSPKERPCPVCYRDGYFSASEQPDIPALRRDSVRELLQQASDRVVLLRTWEIGGLGRREGNNRTVPPTADLVVSQRARQILMASAKVKWRWTPIKLV